MGGLVGSGDWRAVARAQLVANSAALALKDPGNSIRLAIEAFHYQPMIETRSALLSAQDQYYAGQFTGHTGTIYGVAFSPDRRTLATASADGTTKVWDVASHQLITTLTGHTNYVLRKPVPGERRGRRQTGRHSERHSSTKHDNRCSHPRTQQCPENGSGEISPEPRFPGSGGRESLPQLCPERMR
jgi:WD domain, G-beta repeat